MDQDEIIVLPSGKYKVGAHGFVYRWSNFNQEWVRTSMEIDELEKEHEIRKQTI